MRIKKVEEKKGGKEEGEHKEQEEPLENCSEDEDLHKNAIWYLHVYNKMLLFLLVLIVCLVLFFWPLLLNVKVLFR